MIIVSADAPNFMWTREPPRFVIVIGDVVSQRIAAAVCPAVDKKGPINLRRVNRERRRLVRVRPQTSRILVCVLVPGGSDGVPDPMETIRRRQHLGVCGEGERANR